MPFTECINKGRKKTFSTEVEFENLSFLYANHVVHCLNTALMRMRPLLSFYLAELPYFIIFLQADRKSDDGP